MIHIDAATHLRYATILTNAGYTFQPFTEEWHEQVYSLFKTYIRRFASSFREEEGIVCVDAKGTLAGALTYTVRELDYGRIAYIHDLAVKTAYRNQGIGTVMLNMLAGRCNEHGVLRIIGNCHKDLRPYYRRIGYRTFPAKIPIVIPEDPTGTLNICRDRYYSCWMWNPA
ncbi:GNAT family N-acetyltransferase [Bifidobacterium sp. SO1]|uniref:GNAT family N-acetyltransferase n=1 Tax=Bifidobacterium sp. SO1 TaxID=2809029 RepID=UPI001BDDC3FD|nr:GNAT family N-acetyltransferase [Bifidobacterium sp. SO1]MBT1162940.1 GNAT family N-acetyltransferase [Bifidobacterium sp. SO1]